MASTGDPPADVLEDLRMLKLAEMYEMAYERFVNEMAERVVRSGEAHHVLKDIAPRAGAHRERIAHHLARLSDLLDPSSQQKLEQAALQDVVDLETAGREFYVRGAARLHDPLVSALFHDLAREEGEYARLAEGALSAIGGPQASREVDARLRVMLGEEDVPLREGVTDYGNIMRRLDV